MVFLLWSVRVVTTPLYRKGDIFGRLRPHDWWLIWPERAEQQEAA